VYCARRRHAEQLTDDAVADVLDVARPRTDVPACSGEHVSERVGGVPHGAGRRDALLTHGVLGEVGELGVGGHHGRRLQDRLRLALGLAGAGPHVGGDQVHRRPDPGHVGVGVCGWRTGRRLGDGV